MLNEMSGSLGIELPSALGGKATCRKDEMQSIPPEIAYISPTLILGKLFPTDIKHQIN